MNELARPIERSEPGWLVQALWLIFVGWWAGGLATALAWFLNNTVIGLPAGLWILNRLPMILALQNPGVSPVGRDLPQHGFVLRAAYFLLIGWWWSGVWLAAAYALSLTIVLLPIALPMVRLAPYMTTLRRF
jgi:uncharacterized membrane protein YccF (DUF307 family)